MGMNEILKPHNVEPYQNLVANMSRNQNVAIVSATGTGKTYLYTQLQANYPDKRTLYLSPYRGINWATDDLLSNYKVPVNTASTSETPKNCPKANVVFSTYQKVGSLKNASPKDIKEIFGDNFDLVVLDEYHHLGAEVWGAGFEKIRQTYPSAKNLGLTATDIRYLDGERDMTQELFGGNVAFKRLLPDALREGILPTPTVISGAYTYEKEIADRMKKIDELNDETERKEALALLAQTNTAISNQSGVDTIFSKYMKDRTNGKLVVFCEDLAHQELIAQIIPQWFKGVNEKVNVRVINSELPKDENYNSIKDFENASNNGIELLVSVNMINAGVHLDGIDGIVLIPRDGSPNRLEQRLGRALASGGKNPLIFDLSDSIGQATQISQHYKSIKDRAINPTAEQGEPKKRERTFANMENFVIIDEQKEARELLAQLDDKLSRFKSYSLLGSDVERAIYSAYMNMEQGQGRKQSGYETYTYQDVARALNLEYRQVVGVIQKFKRWEQSGNWDRLLEVMPQEDYSFGKVDHATGEIRGAINEVSTPNHQLRNMRRNELDLDQTGFEDDVYARMYAESVHDRVFSDKSKKEMEKQFLDLIEGRIEGASGLTDRETLVLRLRLHEKKNLEQVGEVLGVSRERVRQIEAKAFRKLRHPSRAKHFNIDEYAKSVGVADNTSEIMQEYLVDGKSATVIGREQGLPSTRINIIAEKGKEEVERTVEKDLYEYIESGHPEIVGMEKRVRDINYGEKGNLKHEIYRAERGLKKVDELPKIHGLLTKWQNSLAVMERNDVYENNGRTIDKTRFTPETRDLHERLLKNHIKKVEEYTEQYNELVRTGKESPEKIRELTAKLQQLEIEQGELQRRIEIATRQAEDELLGYARPKPNDKESERY